MDLVCPYCKGPLEISMAVRPGYGAYDYPESIDCEAWDCDAEFATDGKMVRAGKTPAASPGGDDEPPKASTEPSAG